MLGEFHKLNYPFDRSLSFLSQMTSPAQERLRSHSEVSKHDQPPPSGHQWLSLLEMANWHQDGPERIHRKVNKNRFFKRGTVLLHRRKGQSNHMVLEALHKRYCVSKLMVLWTAIYEQYASHLLHSYKPGQRGAKWLLWTSHGIRTAFRGTLWVAWEQCPAMLISCVPGWNSMGTQLFLSVGFIIIHVLPLKN